MLFSKRPKKPRATDALTLWMAPIERAQLQAVLAAVMPRVALEWGAGGSTRFILDTVPTIERYVSVENDAEWFHKLERELSDPRLSLHLVEPNVPAPGNRWKNEAERRRIMDWRRAGEHDASIMADYVAKPRSLGEHPYDFVLVDGRARVFCLKEGFELLRPGGVMVLHDGHRPEYQATLDALRAVRLEPWEQGQIVVVRRPDAS